MCSLSCSCLLLRLKFLLFTWCFFFQSWVVLLKLHNIVYSCDFIYYTHILKVFFFLLLSGVCKHSSFIHSSLWALFLFSRRQMLLCYIDCVNFHRHLWCLTNVIMHYSLSSQCIWSNKFCLWGIFFFIQWRDGGGERAVFQHVLVIWAHAKHWHHVSIFRVVALTWFSHSELCLTSNINTG